MKLNQIIGLLALSAMLCWAAPARADHVDDAKKEGPEHYCQGLAQVFHDGADFQLSGAERDLKSISRKDYEVEAAKGNDAPKDGIYYIDFDTFTDQEKEVITYNVQAGWDFAKQFPNQGDIEAATARWYGLCVRQFGKEERSESFIQRSASSEKILRYSPNGVQAEYCTDLSVRRYNECMNGVISK